MTHLSVLCALSGISASKLRKLVSHGLEFEEDDFEIDARHRKAIFDLRYKRMSPYVIAYAYQCNVDGPFDDGYYRYDSIDDIASLKGLSIREALQNVQPKKIDHDLLPTAKHWIDEATKPIVNPQVFERLARWCKAVICQAPPFEVDHAYLAVRLLLSVPRQEMLQYPKLVQRALNRTKFHGYLDGWYHVCQVEGGKNRTVYKRAQWDL